MKNDTIRVDALQLFMGMTLVGFAYLLFTQGHGNALLLFGVPGLVFFLNLIMNRFAFKSYYLYGFITLVICLALDLLAYYLFPSELSWTLVLLTVGVDLITVFMGVLFHMLHRETLYNNRI